jgi:hypothetical protein
VKINFNFGNMRTSLLLGIFIPALVCVGSDEPSSDAVFIEYKKGLKVLEEKFDHCRGDGVFSSFRVPKNSKDRIETKAKIEFAFSGGKGRQARSPMPWKEPDPMKTSGRTMNYQTILGYNDRYSFTVGRPTPSADPVIESLDPGEKLGRSQIDNSVGYLSRSPIAIHQVRLSHFIEIPGFRVDRVIEVNPANEPRRLKFEFTLPKKSGLAKNARPIVAGWFVVTPDEGWLVHEYGNVHAAPTSGEKIFTYVGHVNYQKNSRGEQVPTKANVRLYLGAFDSDPAIISPSTSPVSGEDFEYTSFEFSDAPASAFTLSGFGLPEYGQTVAQVSSARSRPWWTVALAVLSGVAALGLRRLATRNREAKVPGQL